MAEERALSSEQHDHMLKEAAQQHQDLLQQVYDANTEALRIETELKAMRATMEQECLEVQKDSDAAAARIAELQAKIKAAEIEWQHQQEHRRQRHLDVQQEALSSETDQQQFSLSSAALKNALQADIVSIQKQIELTVDQHDQARADLERRAQEFEMKRQRELAMRQITFENECRSRNLQHQAQVKVMHQNHKTHLDDHCKQHNSEQQDILAKVESLTRQVSELSIHKSDAESLDAQLKEARECTSELQRIKGPEAAKVKLDHQRQKSELITAQVEELDRDRLGFEEAVRNNQAEWDAVHGQLQEQFEEACKGCDPRFMSGIDIDFLQQHAEQHRWVQLQGSSHPEALKLRERVERDFASIVDKHAEAVHQENKEEILRAREDAHSSAELERKRTFGAREEKLSEAEANLTQYTRDLQTKLEKQDAAHRQRLEAMRRQATEDTASAMSFNSDLERQVAMAEETAKHLEATLKDTLKVNLEELKNFGDKERRCIDDLRIQEREAELQFERQAEEIIKSPEIQELEEESRSLVDNVHQEALLEAQRNQKTLISKLERDVLETRSVVDDLLKQYETADKQLDQSLKYRQEKLRERQASLLRGTPTPDRRKNTTSVDPLDDTLNRMILLLFRSLVVERYAGLNANEVGKSFDRLPRDTAGCIVSSPPEVAEEVANLLASRKRGDIREVFWKLDQRQTGKVIDGELEMCFKQAFNLDPESRGHIVFLVESMIKSFRRSYAGSRPGDGSMSEDDFARLFEDVRIGSFTMS